MSESKLKRTLRGETKAHRLGSSARCLGCGESDLRALQQVSLCAECRLRIADKGGVENHHPAGRKNDSFTIPLLANAHAVLSDSQTDWPRETLSNSAKDLLNILAAWLRAIRDTLLHLAEKSEEWAKLLERLAAYLSERLGAGWWSDFLVWQSGSTAA